MATDDAEEERRRHKHRRRHHSSSRRRRDEAHQEPALLPDEPPAPADEAFDRPSDVAALREARLKAMATPTTARKKMKLEYQYTRPVKPPATVKYKPPRTSAAGLLGRRASVLAVRPKSSSTIPTTKKGTKDDDYQYVYKSNNPSMIDRRDFQIEHDSQVRPQPRAAIERRNTTASATNKPKIQRRKTEPAPTVRRSSTTATRPPARKGSTSVRVSQVKATDTIAEELVEETDKIDPVIGAEPSPKPQRASSMFGTLFAKQPPVPEKQVSCQTCKSDDIPLSKSAKLSCDHRICHACLKRIFTLSVKDSAHMPPRCCTDKHIALKHVDSLFDADFKKNWNKKFREYQTKIEKKQVSCLTCGSDDIPVSKSVKLPCGHRMCHSCLKRIFKMSIKDPAHMPPRCCTDKHIALKHVDSLFDADFKKNWNKKFEEYTTKNRIYCYRQGCGEWIQPKHMRVEQGRKIGVCPKCKHAVCATCNQRAHRSRECPKDPAMKQLNDIAEQQGWRKCFNCSAMVELKEGCNHMTCRCMAEFCMVCGLKWKSCDCPWFNYQAVDDLQGNPIRYQQEMDRRQEQMVRDEEIARQMAGLGVRDRHRRRTANVADFQVIGPPPEQPNAEFLQQAREVLTANYQNAEAAARGLLGGWLAGQEAPMPPMPGAFDQIYEFQPQQPVRAAPIARRRTQRMRHANPNEVP